MKVKMRKRLPAVLAVGALALALAFTGCPGPGDDSGPGETPPAPNVTAVTVGPQSGTVTAGTAGTVTFPV